jgi:hypothetical protein
MHQLIGFVGGALFAAVLGETTRRKVWHPLAREVVKGGIVGVRKAQAIGQAIAEESKKLAAEARAELDQETQNHNEEAKD